LRPKNGMNRITRLASSSAMIALALAAMTPALAQPPSAQRSNGQSNNNAPPPVDVATAKALNAAIDALNMGKYDEARAALAPLKIDKLSPYEHSRLEQVLSNVAAAQEKYDEARAHIDNAIEAGGLNEQETSDLRYQIAQLFMAEGNWKAGAATLEEWFKTAPNPNAAAFYLLAAAYYQSEDYERALAPAKRAVELMATPQENWIGMLLALYVQREQFKDAIPLLLRLIELAPDKKTYWVQLSAIYGQVDDYANALAIMQLAYGAGLLTEDAEIRRLADLQLFNGIPYRCGQLLESSIERRSVNVDDKLLDKLANCWIAAGELEKALPPLAREAEITGSGETFVRLAEVHLQRSDWPAAQNALERAINKGQLKDVANAQVLLGLALLSQHKLAEARPWFERAQQSEKHRQTAKSYLQLIDSQIAAVHPLPK
jgi:tetratricopeptide (TPR) repeat protein